MHTIAKCNKGETVMDWMKVLSAFIVGGAICVVGQLLIEYTNLTPARILVAFVVSGVVLTGLGIYQPIVEFAGAGATVPLTGFGHLLATGVQKAIATDGFLGVITGGLTAAAGGVTAAIFFGMLCGMIAPHKAKT